MPSTVYQLKFVLRIAKLLWNLRDDNNNAKFLAIVREFKDIQTPLAYHAEFYTKNLLNSKHVHIERNLNDVITIKLHLEV